MDAKRATATPEGMVVLDVPAPLVETKSGPQIALTETATHIAVIASDAHISLMRKSAAHVPSWMDAAGGCEMLDMSRLLSQEKPPWHAPVLHQRDH
jgi:hypothetical protein